jgi:hypothetical protein
MFANLRDPGIGDRAAQQNKPPLVEIARGHLPGKPEVQLPVVPFRQLGEACRDHQGGKGRIRPAGQGANPLFIACRHAWFEELRGIPGVQVIGQGRRVTDQETLERWSVRTLRDRVRSDAVPGPSRRRTFSCSGGSNGRDSEPFSIITVPPVQCTCQHFRQGLQKRAVPACWLRNLRLC